METRIKYIKKNNGWYYAVQVKIWIFWKTIYTDVIFANVEKFIDTLGQIDDFNNKAKSSNKIVYDGWICPKCGRYYSPFVSMCSFCNNGNWNTTITYYNGSQ